ncbi:MAG: hypothetical protein JWP91_4039 [Fibrobacteres bacterium]|nr:hypothetical protein [Fibrobacterota bacterium]
MKFLALAYYHEKTFEKTPPEEMRAIVAQCGPLDAALNATGKMEMVASLAATKDTVSVRPRNGKPSVTDGPYVETKEQLGSFFLLEAEDMQEAIRLASMHPAANLGEKMGWGIEIRPIEFCRAKEMGVSKT